MPDLSTMLANWKAGSLRQRPPKALLGKLESTFRDKQAKLLQYGNPTTPREIGELNEARREFREQWGQMRREIIAGYDADIETQRREANPRRSAELEQAMGRKTQIYLPKWERSYGAMIRDAERFELEGDQAGLELVREHVGLVENRGAHRTLLEGVTEALDAYKTDGQRQAEQQVQTLESERETFRSGTGMRQGGMVRAMAEPIGPAPAAPSPAAVPQR